MTPEERIEMLEKHLLGLRAVQMAQAAELSALLALLRSLDTALDEALDRPNGGDRWNAAFLALRKTMLQQLLLRQEEKDPGLAAKMSELLDQPGLSYPVTWD